MSESLPVSWMRASCLALAITALGRAIQIGDGTLMNGHEPIAWLTVAIGLVLVAVFFDRPQLMHRRSFQITAAICVLVNLIQFATAKVASRVVYDTVGDYRFFNAGVNCVAFFSACALIGSALIRKLAVVGVAATVLIMGGRMISLSPDPHIDVYVFQSQSADALATGQNPYELTYPNIYGPDIWTYGKGVVQNNRLQFGYPYFPVPLYGVTPAAFLHFDVRYAHLGAAVLAATLLAFCGGELRGDAVAVLILTMPRLLSIVNCCFTEVFVVLALVAALVVAVRWPVWLFVPLGVFFASKQYIPVAILFLFLANRPIRQSVRLAALSLAVAAVLIVPLAAWDLSAFLKSAIFLQFRQPFRNDAISYLGWLGEAFWPKWAPTVIPFAALLLAIGLIWWKRRSMNFCMATAFSFLVFFAFNKQAFAGYYFFVMGACACAMIEGGRDRVIA